MGNGRDAVEKNQLSLPGTFQQLHSWFPFQGLFDGVDLQRCYLLKNLLKSQVRAVTGNFSTADNSD